MPNLLRAFFSIRRSVFLLLLSLGVVSSAYSQGCDGADGSGIFIGSIANRDNGTRCANLQGQPGFAPGLMEIDISNIDESGTIQFQINWDDGSPFQAVNATKIGPNRYFASVTHNFPPAGGDVKCEYRPVVQLIFNGAVCSANLGTPPRFVRWNTDDQNTGELNLTETATGVNEYLVCAGVETNVTFTDRTTLNCVPPQLDLGPNTQTRWRQFIYGTGNTITGTVRIGGVPRGFPYNGAVDTSPDPVFNSGFPTATTQIITVPATAQVGEIFEIRMNYWNTCNSFLLGRAPVIETARIRIVDQPPAPNPNPATQTVCRGTTPANPAITSPGGNAVISWWRNDPGDVPGTLITSGSSNSLNISQVPGYVNNTTAGTYKVWVSYRFNIANALNCESPKVLITRTIRELLTVPNPVIPATSPVCQGTPVSITLPAPATMPFGGPTEYLFSGTGGLTVSGSDATSATYNTSGVTFAGSALSSNVNIRVRRRYTPSNSCQVQRDFPITVFRQPVAGTPSDFPDVCEGTVVGPITLNGFIGTVTKWQMRIGAGAWNDIPASNSNSITPGVLTAGGAGTLYSFRAVVGNGPCTEVISPEESVLVSPNPGITVNAGPDQAFCNVLSTNLAGTDPAPLTGTWEYVSSVPAGRPAPSFTANDPNTPLSITAGNEGAYVMRWTVTSGSCTFIDEVTIDFGAPPNIPALAPINACDVTTTLNAPALATGTGTWSVVAGNVASLKIDDINSPASGLSLNGPAYDYGIYALRWTVNSGTCVETEDVQVTFFEPLTVSATDINGVCLLPGGSVIGLSGTFGGGFPAAATGSWEVVTASGTVSSIVTAGVNVTADYNAVAADYAAGTNLTMLIRASIGGVCPDATQEITVNVDKTPIADAGLTPQPACSDFVQLNAATPVDATGQWTGVGVTFDDVNDPKTIVRNLPAAPGSVVVRWTLTSTGGNSCTAFDEVTVQSVTRPNATDLSPIICETLPAGSMLTQVLLQDFEDDVTTEPVANRTIQWFENGPEPFGTPVADASIPLTGVPENKIYVAKITETVSGTGCVSNAYVNINIRPLPTSNDATIPLCEDNAGMGSHAGVDLVNDITYKNAVTSASNDVSWYPTFADATANNVGAQITAPFDVVTSRNVFARISYPSGEACPIVASASLVVNQIPVASIIGDPTVCMGSAATPVGNLPVEIYQTTSYSGAKYFWTIPTGPGQFVVHEGGEEDDFFVLLKFPFANNPPDENISVRVELQGCSFTAPVFPITRSAVPQAPVILGDEVVCALSEDVQYTIQTPSSNDYNWRFYLASSPAVEGGAIVATGQSTSIMRANFQAQNVILQVTESNSGNNECVSTPATMNITVNQLPKMLPGNPVTCSGLDSGVLFQSDNNAPNSTTDFYRLTAVTIGSGLTLSATSAPIPAVPSDGAADMLSLINFQNTTETPKSVIYEVAPVNRTTVGAITKDCLGPTALVLLTVNPEPTLETGLGRNICSDERTEVTLRTSINSYPADKYIITEIEQTTDPSNPLVRVGPAAPLGVELNADAIFNDVWVNPGSPVQNSSTPFIITYKISAKNTVTQCIGDPAVTLQVGVYPKPNITFTADPVCSDRNIDINLAAANVSGANTNWSWTVQNITTNLRGATPGTSPSGNTALIGDMITNESFTAGTVVYNVTAVTALGGKTCSTTVPVSVDVNPSPQVTQIPQTPICSDTPNNGLTRVIDLTTLEASIANPATTNILWYTADPEQNPGATIGNPTNFPIQNEVAVYAQVTNDDAFQCVTTVPVIYTVNNAVALQITETDVSCNGANNGSILAEVQAGGTAPFFFRKNGEPFASSAGDDYTFLALAPNQTYDITVQDSKGCQATLTSQLITEPTPLLLQTVDATPVDCFFDSNLQKDRNGVVNIVATGSSGSYTYTLTPGGFNNTTGVFNNLRPGSYSIVVSDLNDAACKVEFSPVIVDVPEPVEIVSLLIPEDSYGNQISCHGADNGEVQITARGGSGAYNMSLDPYNPPTPKPGLANQVVVFDGLTAGSYKVLVEDTKGCRAPQAIATIRDVLDLFPGKIGTDQNICLNQANAAGDAQPFTEVLSPFGGPSGNIYEYQWQSSLDNSNWVNIGGATTQAYDADGGSPLPAEGAYYFRRLIRSALPTIDLNNRPSFCNDYLGQDGVVIVNVRPKPDVTIVGNGLTCQGSDEFYQLRLDVGTAPMKFTWDDGSVVYNNQTANQLSAPYKVANIQQPTLVGFYNITDAYECIADNETINIDILQVDANFQVDATPKCAGDTFNFTYTPAPDIQYVWEFGDGTTTGYAANDPLIDGSESHTYALSASSQADATFIVKLTAALDGGGCPNSTFKEVTVRRSIILNILEPQTEICHGETVKFKDNSTGVSSGTWYYEDQFGNRGPDIAGPVSEVSFTLPNNTTGNPNPLEYTIFYDAENTHGCPAEPYQFGPIFVYRAATPAFTINPNPAQMIGGLVNVSFINTSDPLDAAFTYDWEYGNNVESVVENGFDRAVVYNTDEQREITLTVTNPLRPSCVASVTNTLNINIENPDADFIATRAGCYPLTVTVKNLSVSADKFLWHLTSSNGTDEKSALREPTFNIFDPGTYTLTLTAQKEGNPTFIKTITKTIEVFPKPVAEFFLRQTHVYTGQEVKPVNESLNACGDCFTWDFGDGTPAQVEFEPSHSYTLEGKYTITLTASVNYGDYDIDGDGTVDGPVICSGEKAEDIMVIPGGALKIPNAFTPNVNGPNGGTPDNNFTNDVFLPIMDGVEEFTMHIFDRWGNLLFESKDKQIGWDGYDRNGRLMPAGVYVYKVVLRLGDGQRTTKVGDVTLIR